MGLVKTRTSGATFIGVSNGKFRRQVEEGTEGSEKRVVKRDDGTEIIKHELVFDGLDGGITLLEFKDVEFGKKKIQMLDVHIGGVILSMNTDSRYFSDFAKKLPVINLSKEVSLTPYDFESEGRRFIGVTIRQDGIKLQNYFYDGETNINGFPFINEVDRDGMDSGDWTVYFIKVKKFLVSHIGALEKNYYVEPEVEVNTETPKDPTGAFDDKLDEVKEKSATEVSDEEIPF